MLFIGIFIFVILLGVLFNSNLKVNKYKKMYVFICFSVMFLFQALRANTVGKDTLQYIQVFNHYKDSDYYAYAFKHYDLGVRTLVILLDALNFDAQSLLIVLSFIIMFCMGFFIYKTSDDVMLSVVIFVGLLYPNSFNVIRQYVCCSIALCSLYYFKNNKYKRFLILFVLSLLFHKISVILLIPIILSKVQRNKISVSVLIIFLIFTVLFGEDIFNGIIRYYRGNYYFSDQYITNRMFRLTSIMVVIFAVFFHFLSQNYTIKDSKNYILMSSIILFNITFAYLYLKNEIYSRIIEFLNSYLVVSIPFAISVKKDKFILIYRIIVVAVVFALMINFVFLGEAGIKNYEFFFN